MPHRRIHAAGFAQGLPPQRHHRPARERQATVPWPWFVALGAVAVAVAMRLVA